MNANAAPTPSTVPAVTMQGARPDVIALDIAPPAVLRGAFAAPANNDDYVARARAFLAATGARYGVAAPEQRDLAVADVRHSLLGVHVHLQESHDGIPVVDSGVTVSFDDSGDVRRVHSSAKAASAFVSSSGHIDGQRAIEAAWRELKVHGRLLAQPSAQLLYTKGRASAKSAAQLIQRVSLHTEAPRGAWQLDVDAFSGAVLDVIDTTVHSHGAAAQADFAAYRGPVDDLAAATARLENENAARARSKPSTGARSTVDGTALVFDPDPITALGAAGSALTDTSPAASFRDAYKEVVLHEVTLDGTAYRLEGPWVKLIDFESPVVAPSTRPDGHWTALRGDDAFDDAMVYFHIDKTQRYIQSLGYTGARGIQFGAIEVDSNGVDGDDNSHFIPGSNRLAFGHGCVNDSEDADVILHEYGHAISYSINHGWNGGDTGAMGEGFSDYWALSADADDPAVEPSAKVYTWDSAGGCWPGRRADTTAAQYDATKTYGAHATVGGVDGDELWSTPLFQGLLALRRAGVSRRETNIIYLEAMFGFTSGMTMRELATAIIATATRLHPTGVHAAELSKVFAAQGFIERSVPEGAAAGLTKKMTLTGTAKFTAASSIAVAIRGDSADLEVTLVAPDGTEWTLHNRAPGVTLKGVYPTTLTPVTSLNGLIGKPLAGDWSLRVVDHDVNGKLAYVDSFKVDPGPPVADFPAGTIIAAVTPGTAIADNAEIVSEITVPAATGNVGDVFGIDVDIAHTYIGDLTVTLVSPAGTSVILHKRTGSSTDNIRTTYPQLTAPAASLTALRGQPLSGAWKLRVADGASGDQGTLTRWAIHYVAAP